MKEHRFKHKPELLSSSQYSLLDSQEAGGSEVENGGDNEDKEKEASTNTKMFSFWCPVMMVGTNLEDENDLGSKNSTSGPKKGHFGQSGL